MTGYTAGIPTSPTYTYNFSPLTNDVDRMRLMLGDTGNGNPSAETCIYADQEILFFVEEADGNYNMAAYYACLSQASKYAQMADKELGPMSIDYSDVSESYREQALYWYNNATNNANINAAPYSFTSELGMRDIPDEQGNLKVPPFFNRNEMRNYADTDAEDRTHE